MKVLVTVTREFEMDEKRILTEPGFAPPPSETSVAEKQKWLEESFWELCGFGRDEDHVNGSYVHCTDDWDETVFEWPEGLR